VSFEILFTFKKLGEKKRIVLTVEVKAKSSWSIILSK